MFDFDKQADIDDDLAFLSKRPSESQGNQASRKPFELYTQE